MKTKPILAAAFLLLSFSLSAQTERGTVFLGGNPGFGIATSRWNFFLNPQAGYFLHDNWLLGARGGLQLELAQRADDTWETSFLLRRYDLFTRYYFLPEKKWRPFAEVGWRWDRSFDQSVYAAGWVAYFPTPLISIEASLQWHAYLDGAPSRIGVSGLNLGLNFHLFNQRKKERQ